MNPEDWRILEGVVSELDMPTGPGRVGQVERGGGGVQWTKLLVTV